MALGGVKHCCFLAHGDFPVDDNHIKVHFDPGRVGNNVAVILQNPGSEEAFATPCPHPAAGKTGENLEEVLCAIQGQFRIRGVKTIAGCNVDDFIYNHTAPGDGVMVANAYSQVYCGNKAMPAAHIPGVHFEKGNPPPCLFCEQIRFVAAQIASKGIILCFGAKAAMCYWRIMHSACAATLREDHKVVICCHLSPQGIRPHIQYDLNGEMISTHPANKRMRFQIEVIAKYCFEVLAEHRSSTFKEFVQELACGKCRRNGMPAKC